MADDNHGMLLVRQAELADRVDTPAIAEARRRFATFIRAVARGASLGRSLSEEEAREAMRLVLAEIAEPVQVGAFLAVLRYRKETPEELAGFVRAARDSFVGAPAGVLAKLDWPSYADKHKQLPYFVLSALLLVEAGMRILMHGIDGEGPAATPKVLAALGIAASRSLAEAGDRVAADGFAYVELESFCPGLARVFALKPVLGVRSAANSFAREINPSSAPCQIQGVFHPTYLPTHVETARRLGQRHAAIFKGGAGEAQRNPEKACRVALLHDGEAHEDEWPALAPDARHPWRDEPLDPARVAALWRGDWAAPGPLAAVIGTAAIALKLLGRAPTIEAAEAEAARLWAARPKDKYGHA